MPDLPARPHTGQSGVEDGPRVLRYSPQHRRPPKRNTSGQLERVALLSLPSVIFAFLCLLFATVYHWAPALVWFVVLVLVATGISQWRKATSGRSEPLRFYLALESLIAVLCAVLAGLLVYRAYLMQYWTWADSHVYANILPSEPAGGYLDAGKIVFADDSVVSRNESVGFKDGGMVYCVAPVLDDPVAVEQEGQPVHFWAVGKDCCAARGGFACDDVWDWRARSGLVLHGRHLPRQYMEAVQQAQAAFGLAKQDGPVLFMRWLRDPEVMELDYWRAGSGLLLVAILAQALASLVASWFIRKAMTGVGGLGFR